MSRNRRPTTAGSEETGIENRGPPSCPAGTPAGAPGPGRPIETLLHAFSNAWNYRFLRESTSPPGVELIVLPGVDPGGLKRTDFSRALEWMARARDAAGRFLDAPPGT